MYMKRAVMVAVIAACLVPASADAISRKHAGAVALRSLRPQVWPGPTAVYGLQKPVGVGHVVAAWSLSPKRRMPVVRLRRRAWLFWEDLGYGANLSHPSFVLLIDDRTGKLLWLKSLDMYPLLDGRAPAFVSSTGYGPARLTIYARYFEPTGTRGATNGGARDAVAHAAQGSGPITKDDLKNECLVTIGDRGPKAPGNGLGDQALADNLRAMDAWAESVKMTHLDSPSNASDLKLTVYRAVATRNCKDVLIYISGHGVAPTPAEVTAASKKLHIGPWGVTAQGGAPLPGGPAGIQIQSQAGDLFQPPRQTLLTPAEVTDAIKTINAGGSVTTDKGATIEVKAMPNVGFKLKIDSCWSGRFAAEIAKDFKVDPSKPDPKSPIRMIEFASSAWEPSFKHLPKAYKPGTTTLVDNPTDNPRAISEFTNANIHGLDKWMANPVKGRDLASGLQQAFNDGADQDWARTLGLTHPGGVGPGLALGSPDDTAVTGPSIQLGGGSSTTTTTTVGPPVITGGP
jgi:hypothetical protein